MNLRHGTDFFENGIFTKSSFIFYSFITGFCGPVLCPKYPFFEKYFGPFVLFWRPQMSGPTPPYPFQAFHKKCFITWHFRWVYRSGGMWTLFHLRSSGGADWKQKKNVWGGGRLAKKCVWRFWEKMKYVKGDQGNFPFPPPQDFKWNSPY